MKIGRLAGVYRWIEYAAFGRALERLRFVHLAQLRTARNILVLGEGDGRALTRLLSLAPMARIDVIEVSPEMVALATRRSAHADRVRFHCADARTMPLPAPRYDGIVTQFFLDCFHEAEARAIIGRLAAALAPAGLWLMSDFAIPDTGWRRAHARLWIRTMYFFFRLTTKLGPAKLPPIEKLLREAGLRCVERSAARAGLMVSEVWVR